MLVVMESKEKAMVQMFKIEGLHEVTLWVVTAAHHQNSLEEGVDLGELEEVVVDIEGAIVIVMEIAIEVEVLAEEVVLEEDMQIDIEHK